MEKPKSVAAYFRSLPKDQRGALQTLRETIAAAAPEAQEGITYSMPGFLLDGHGFVAYAAFKDHYSFFPMSGLAVDAHRNELGDAGHGQGNDPVHVRRAIPHRAREEGGPNAPGRGRREAGQAEDVAAASISASSFVVVFQFRIVTLG